MKKSRLSVCKKTARGARKAKLRHVPDTFSGGRTQLLRGVGHVGTQLLRGPDMLGHRALHPDGRHSFNEWTCRVYTTSHLESTVVNWD